MRAGILTVPILLSVAVITSGCWMIFGMPNMGDPSYPTPAPVIVTAGPSQAGNDGSCGRAEYRFEPKRGQAFTDSLKRQMARIERGRLNSLNVSPVTQTATPNGLMVTFPASIGWERIRDVVGRTGHLDFLAVPTAYAQQVAQGAPLPAGMDATPMFSGDQIASVHPGEDATGLPALDITLKPEGARVFDAFAKRAFNGANGGVKFAIVLDGIVESALGLNTDHFNGEAQIVGSFTSDQVIDLAIVLESGPLPVDVHEVRFTQIPCAPAA